MRDWKGLELLERARWQGAGQTQMGSGNGRPGARGDHPGQGPEGRAGSPIPGGGAGPRRPEGPGVGQDVGCQLEREKVSELGLKTCPELK